MTHVHTHTHTHTTQHNTHQEFECHVSGHCLDHTNELWEMEQRQKQDKHQMLKQELREAFHMQRHQMRSRHQKVYTCIIYTDNKVLYEQNIVE